MKTRIFRRFLWSALVLFLSTLLLIDLYIVRHIEHQERRDLRRQLQIMTQILSSEPVSDWHNWVRMAAQRANARVAVLTATGTLIADSAPDLPTPQDSLQQAVVAGRIDGNVLRISAPLGSSHATSVDLRWRLLYISLFSTLLAAGMAYVFMRSFSQRIARIRAYVEGLPEARVENELPAADDELGALAASLRETAPHIRALVNGLKLESARREAILGSMVEGVLALDKELRVIFCNDSFALAAGAATPVPEGIPLVQLVRDPGLLDMLVTVLYTGKRVSRTLRLRATRAHSFEVRAAPLEGPTARGVLVVLHDVTELERLERIRKDFVANVSHELRTPLASIRGYAETLLDGALEDQENNRKFIEIILSQAIRLNNIASDLLTLSELESAEKNAQPKRISVRRSVQAAVRTVEATARLRNVKIVTEQLDDLQVLGDEIRLEQTLINLLDNAIKFNRPEGEVRIETGGVENGSAVITISDTGAGIPSEDLPRIFERFYRVDKARSRAIGGTGLGLSIVKHAVEQMGGDIKVQSQFGKGTQFTIRIPCSADPESKSSA